MQSGKNSMAVRPPDLPCAKGAVGAKRKTFSAKFAETEAYIVTCPGLDIDGTRYLDKHGIKPNVQFSTMDIQATYAMAAAGMGVSIKIVLSSGSMIY